MSVLGWVVIATTVTPSTGGSGAFPGLLDPHSNSTWAVVSIGVGAVTGAVRGRQMRYRAAPALALARGCGTPSRHCGPWSHHYPLVGTGARMAPGAAAMEVRVKREASCFIFFRTRLGLCGGARHPPPGARARISPRIGRVSAHGGVAWKGNARCYHGRITDISIRGAIIIITPGRGGVPVPLLLQAPQAASWAISCGSRG